LPDLLHQPRRGTIVGAKRRKTRRTLQKKLCGGKQEACVVSERLSRRDLGPGCYLYLNFSRTAPRPLLALILNKQLGSWDQKCALNIQTETARMLPAPRDSLQSRSAQSAKCSPCSHCHRAEAEQHAAEGVRRKKLCADVLRLLTRQASHPGSKPHPANYKVPPRTGQSQLPPKSPLSLRHKGDFSILSSGRPTSAHGYRDIR
jgi:hypothetical protein